MIHIDNHEHGERLMEQIGADFSPVTMEVISRTENGVLLGGAIYENYTGKGGSVLAHVAGLEPNWLNRDLLWIMFDYPFVQLDCKQAFGQVKAKNEEARRFNKSLGWEEIFTLEDVYPDDDVILVRMKRENCRFLKLKPKTIARRTADNGQI